MGNGVYTAQGLDSQLRQSEIISNLKQPIFVAADGDQGNGTVFKDHKFLLILSQDCDLLRDYESQSFEEPDVLNEVMLCELEEASILRKKLGLNSTLWKSIQPNNHERFHYLEPIPVEADLERSGIPELLLDFRRYFSLPATEIFRQIGSGAARRRCRLQMPYKEHLQARYGFYCQRVGLPVPHTSPTG